MLNIIKFYESQFDLSVIKKLPITDKFRLVEYIKMMGKINDRYIEGGMKAVKECEFFTKDKTLNLILSWVDVGVSQDMMGRLVEYYIHNFEESDTYLAYLVILGSGAMLMREGIDTPSLMSYHISLLGDEFLKVNYQRMFAERNEIDLTGENVISVKYKDFDFTYRKLKYDLLAILKMSKESGSPGLRELVFKIYDNKDLRLFFSLLDIKNTEVACHLFDRLMKDAPKMDRFLLVASRCLIEDQEIINMHYLLNAVIGKLTNFNKPYSEVMDEIAMREKEIMANVR